MFQDENIVDDIFGDDDEEKPNEEKCEDDGKVEEKSDEVSVHEKKFY